MIVTEKWQGNMCFHLHYQARKHSTVGVFLRYHCSSIPRTTHLSTTPPLVGPWEGNRSLKGEMEPHALVCLVVCTALSCSTQVTTLTQPGRQWSFISPKGGRPFTQTCLQLSSGFWQGFARAVSKEWARWQWDLASNGTLPNPWKILHGKNRV